MDSEGYVQTLFMVESLLIERVESGKLCNVYDLSKTRNLTSSFGSATSDVCPALARLRSASAKWFGHHVKEHYRHMLSRRFIIRC